MNCVYILYFLSFIFYNVDGFFNIDEVNSVYYDINILGQPKIKEPAGIFRDDTVVMVNRYGQQYACSLPQLPEVVREKTKREDSTLPEQNIDISVLLKPMEGAPCLVTTKDWWTYEFCYGHIIKQYHLEAGKPHGTVLVLGKYESEYDWSAGGKGGADASQASRNSNRLQRFHSQYYANGTKCDLTGEPRRTEVRFKCETDVGDYIERVDEPESCRYVVNIATTRVCHHPYLKPNPSRTPHPINCTPVLEENKYNTYMKKEEEKRKVAEEKKLLMKDNIGSETEQKEDNEFKIEFLNIGSTFKHTETLLEESLHSSPIEIISKTQDEKPIKVHEPENENKNSEEKNIDEDHNSKSKTDKEVLTPMDKIARHISELTENEDYIYIKSKNIKETNEKMNDNPTLSELLGETLTDLEQEVEEFSKWALETENTAQSGFWGAMADKVKEMKKRAMEAEGEPEPEPLDKDSVEWDQWMSRERARLLKKDRPMHTLILPKKKTESNVRESLSKTLRDNLLKRYVSDEDSGSKEESSSKKVKSGEESTVMLSSLQENIKNRLKKSGLDVNKHKIEVKIITPQMMDTVGGEGDDELTEEQAQSVETLVVKLMGAHKEELDEKEKHETLNSNYNLMFNEEITEESSREEENKPQEDEQRENIEEDNIPNNSDGL